MSAFMQFLRHRAAFGALFLVLGGGYWAWDATHHDHAGSHGDPMTISAIETEMGSGGFRTEGGDVVEVTGATCAAGENGSEAEPNTHFLCDVAFGNGESDTVVVHVLPDELLFKSEKG